MKRMNPLAALALVVVLSGSAAAIPTEPVRKPGSLTQVNTPVASTSAAVNPHPFVTEFYGPATPAKSKAQKSLLKRTLNRVLSTVTFR